MPAYWTRRGALAWLLWPASVLFRVIVFCRRALYGLHLMTSRRAGVPVIVVGNLVAGGSGKTPLVLYIAELLKAKGWTPGIVSRGYGARLEAPREATITSDPAELGDEPVVLARRSGCTVWVGPDRVRVCQALRARHPDVDVIVLDDGLQHYRLARNLEICVVDARGFGNGFMLPAGPGRAPRPRLRSVDAVVAHDTDAVRGYAMHLEGELLHCLGDARQRRSPKEFAGTRVHAVAGIGDPKRFFVHLGRLGMNVVPHAFPDHHPFVAQDLEFGDDAPVIMTEKDAVKCRRFAKPKHWVYPVRARLDRAFDKWLEEELGERRR